MQEVDIDEEALQMIADKTGGKYFRATDNASLSSVYQEIDQMEKTVVEQTEYEQKDEQFYVFGILGLIALLLSFMLDKTIFRSIV